MINIRVGVIGASSLVGECLLSALNNTNVQVVAFSRSIKESTPYTEWCKLPLAQSLPEISYWICVAPIWVMPEYFKMIEKLGAQRIVVVSSTSRFTKVSSNNASEQAVAAKLIDGETRLKSWAQTQGIDCVILRPTLIYGLGQDKNISEIARFIKRFKFFPLFGDAKGLRQPIHALDVANACVAALRSPLTLDQAYNIGGGQVLTYREMVKQVFAALGYRSFILTVPLWVFRLGVSVLRLLPRYRKWSASMVERMNQDLIFDQTSAQRDLGLQPRAFILKPEDLPR